MDQYPTGVVSDVSSRMASRISCFRHGCGLRDRCPACRGALAPSRIPSDFFDQPGAENVSAVLFSNAGTIARFDRMSVVAGFGAPEHRYQRIGFRFNPDPNAASGIPFSEDVSSPGYSEGWSDELQIFHNPNARITCRMTGEQVWHSSTSATAGSIPSFRTTMSGHR